MPMTITHGRISVAASFVITSIVGASFVFLHWYRQGTALAITFTFLFLLVMGCVHAAGYLLYVQQFEPKPVEAIPLPPGGRISPLYWPAFTFAGVLQGVLGISTALLLDGGRIFALFQIASLGYWLAAFLIVKRRPLTPTKGDIVLIRWGIVFLLVATGNVAPFVWKVIGESDSNGLQRLLGH
jgi:hypothetical protein